ncbi:hypothetical protein BDV09DRAFT_202707 [Aspergillus tetrazonus]
MDSSEANRMATRAQQDLNTYQAKQGLGRKSDSTLESGVDELVNRRFDQPTDVRYGREAVPTASDRKPIPEEEGGIRDDRGRLAPAQGFEGKGGPEDKVDLE